MLSVAIAIVTKNPSDTAIERGHATMYHVWVVDQYFSVFHALLLASILEPPPVQVWKLHGNAPVVVQTFPGGLHAAPQHQGRRGGQEHLREAGRYAHWWCCYFRLSSTHSWQFSVLIAWSWLCSGLIDAHDHLITVMYRGIDGEEWLSNEEQALNALFWIIMRPQRAVGFLVRSSIPSVFASYRSELD